MGRPLNPPLENKLAKEHNQPAARALERKLPPFRTRPPLFLPPRTCPGDCPPCQGFRAGCPLPREFLAGFHRSAFRPWEVMVEARASHRKAQVKNPPPKKHKLLKRLHLLSP